MPIQRSCNKSLDSGYLAKDIFTPQELNGLHAARCYDDVIRMSWEEVCREDGVTSRNKGLQKQKTTLCRDTGPGLAGRSLTATWLAKQC
jgi:hypothetical protein